MMEKWTESQTTWPDSAAFVENTKKDEKSRHSALGIGSYKQVFGVLSVGLTIRP